MRWHYSRRNDPRALPLADRHYSRQKPGSKQFVAPGRCLVLLTAAADALWVSRWQYPEICKHSWPDAWECSLFRNESPYLSSELILEAVSATRHFWRTVPAEGMITFVDASKVRYKRDPGRCFIRAGFIPCGMTKSGLLAFQLKPELIPAPVCFNEFINHLNLKDHVA